MSVARKQSAIEGAIAQGLKLSFFYDLFDREVQPYLVGPHNGEMRMLAYQVGGRTSQRNLPGWRCFILERMTRLRVQRRASEWLEPPERRSEQPQHCINYHSEAESEEEEEEEERDEEFFSWEDSEELSENEYVVN